MFKKIILTGVSVLLLLGAAPIYVEAVGVPLDPNLKPGNVSTFGENTESAEQGVTNIVGRVLTVLLTLSGIVAVFFIIISAWTMIISRGDEDTYGEAKRNLTWVILGLVFLLFAYAIVRFVISFAYQVDEAAPPAEPAAMIEVVPSAYV